MATAEANTNTNTNTMIFSYGNSWSKSLAPLTFQCTLVANLAGMFSLLVTIIRSVGNPIIIICIVIMLWFCHHIIIHCIKCTLVASLAGIIIFIHIVIMLWSYCHQIIQSIKCTLLANLAGMIIILSSCYHIVTNIIILSYVYTVYCILYTVYIQYTGNAPVADIAC